MALENLSIENQKKLNDFMKVGLGELQEIADRRDGLKDKAKTLAEDLGCKPAVLMKSLRTSFRNTLETQKEEINEVETIMQITNRV